jgi:tetratricopeptide (TPR) repeat protein
MNLDKLKEVARRHELREEWRKAIDIYHRASQDLARAGEAADPSLHNRVGDLELKAGDSSAALTAYEQAADAYADQGFFNNAIALCGKILRVNPGRTATYLRLAELHASKNVLAEARKNLLEFVERMATARQVQPLVDGVRKFSDRFARSEEMRQLIAEVLATGKGPDEVQSALEELAADLGLGEEGRRAGGHGGQVASSPQGWGGGGLVFLDTGIDIPVPVLPGGLGGGFGELDAPPGGAPPVAMETEGGSDVPALAFIEPTALNGVSGPQEGAGAVPGFEPTRLVPGDLQVEQAPPIALEATRPEPIEIPGLEPLPEFHDLVSAQGFELEPLDLDADLDAVPLLDVSLDDRNERPVPAGEPMFEGLEVEEAPAGTTAGAGPGAAPGFASLSLSELEATLVRLEEDARWIDGLQVLGEIIRREPEGIPWHQKRVELAYRSGERVQLVGAYLSLAQALDRAGAVENAVLVYRRVIEHDPDNPVASAALDYLAALLDSGDVSAPAAAPEAAQGEEFVDLGALIMEPEPERDTRMRVDQGEPESEDDVDFRETLEQFKQGVEANLDATDFQAHYDLGIAFKEMGLLDEAIAQFQKALRSPEGRLKSSEAVGVAFHDKGRYAIAEAVLSRAVDALPGADDEKIGLIYWLGRAIEAQGRPGEALRCYERALAVDITFLDLSDRIQHLTTENVE